MNSATWYTGTEIVSRPIVEQREPTETERKLVEVKRQIELRRAERELAILSRQSRYLEQIARRVVPETRQPMPAPKAGAVATRTQDLTESNSFAMADYAFAAYADVLNRFAEGGLMAFPLSAPTDRRWGHNYPFWTNDTTLAIWRARARLLVGINSNAQGLLNGVVNYVIGNGFKWRVKPKKGCEVDQDALDGAQRLVDQFTKDNRWSQIEREAVRRSREDGEFFLRLFPQSDGTMSVRFVEPEQVRPPASDGGGSPEWSYGIHTEPDDICSVIEYNVGWASPGGESDEGQPDIVPAERIIHCKVNVPSSVKRGLTDFSFQSADHFENAGKLLKNMGLGAAVQAAIAAIRQHDTATADQVESLISDTLTYQANDLLSNNTNSYQVLDAGSFLDIPKGMNYVPPPAATNGAIHVQIQQALLRSAGARHNAPEWLTSGDASNNNYASSLTAESPWVKNCEALQQFYGDHFCKAFDLLLTRAVELGLLPEYFPDVCQIEPEFPRVQSRNIGEEATANDANLRNKVTSPQKVAASLGNDYHQIAEDWEQHEERFGPVGNPLAMGGVFPPSGEFPAQESGKEPESLREDRWVTIGAKSTGDGKKGGVPVQLDDRGKIVKGPGHMVGKRPDRLDVAFGTPGAKPASRDEITAKADELRGKRHRGELHKMLGTLGHRELKAFAKDNGLRTPGGKKELVRSIAAQLTADLDGKKAIHRDARKENVHPQAVEQLAKEIHTANLAQHRLERTVRREVAKLHQSYNGTRMPSYKALQGKDVTAIKSYDVILDGLRKAPETKDFFAGMDRQEAESKLSDIITSKPSPAPDRNAAREEALSHLRDNPDASYWRKGKSKPSAADVGQTVWDDSVPF